LQHGSPLHHVPFFLQLSHTFTLKKVTAGFVKQWCLYTKLHDVSHHKTAILMALHGFRINIMFQVQKKT
jgi:hypothetical protein